MSVRLPEGARLLDGTEGRVCDGARTPGEVTR